MTQHISLEHLTEIEERANKAVGSLLSADIIDLIAEIKRLKIELALERGENIRLRDYIEVKGQQIERLIDRLTQDGAAVIQWVTYDGTMKTLPIQGRRVLLERLYGQDHPVVYLVYGANDHWCTLDRSGLVSICLQHGDRWAYLPEPPKVKQ